MRRFCEVAMIAGACALGAAAQDGLFQVRTGPEQMRLEVERMVATAKMISIEGAVMGPAVKGAPYTADEIRESTQVLGDGTRIHNESKATIYRDSEGRVRRETPTEISIWDPTAGTNYVLNPKTMTARKASLQFTYFKTGTGGAGTVTAPPGGWTRTAEAGEKGMVSFGSTIRFNGDSPQVVVTGDSKGTAEGKMIAARREAGNKESLGTQLMEGLTVQGERITNTIEAGAIGNDRPIQTVTERWYSPELQLQVLIKRTDPRNGDEQTKLMNIHRGEPGPVLFEVPPGYTIVGNK